MTTAQLEKKNLVSYLFIIALVGIFGFWIKGIDIASGRQTAGVVIFYFGAVMLTAYVMSQIARKFNLPLLTGYLFAGILAGPYLTGFLTLEMVSQLQLIDDLALSFIALIAGAELRMSLISKRAKSIFLSILLMTATVMGLVMLFVVYMGDFFNVTSAFNRISLFIFAALIGVICVARSPSSAIAIINECEARGPFTGMVLAVTIVTDVLIIIIFTIAIAVSKVLMSGGSAIQLTAVSGLFFEIIVSLILGIIIGSLISFYASRIKYDFLLFLLFTAFAVARLSYWFTDFMEVKYQISLHLEPLLICMSAGFFVQNYSKSGPYLLESLERMSLPIYALFFSIAGASLNFESLLLCWPLAICIVIARMVGLLGGSWLAGTLSHDLAIYNRHAWMTYITQAGVSIGLAQIAARQFPTIGIHLNTVVLAIIAINQIVGPITFKIALNRVGESGKR
jgi:Kef-type K+ transport system membrane component KefB